MKRDQFAGRYAIKLSSSAVVALCNIIVQFLLPRAISVEEYGFYSYNLNIFTSVVVMANLSASSALVAKYAKKCEDIGYVKVYLKFYGIMTLVLTAGLMGLFGFAGIRESFGGQTILSVVLGLESSVLIKLMADVISLYDAAAISRFPSVLHVIQRLLLSAFVVGTYLLGRLDLRLFYFGQIIIFICVIGILIRAFFADFKENYSKPVVRPTSEYIREYYQFCRPLVVAGMISQGIIILMNYTLMKYSGTVEQAMFGAAWQLNTLVGYVFSPYAELMKREFSILTDQLDALMHRFWQSVKTIIWLSSYFAVFIAVFAGWLLPLIYGDKYSGATAVTQMIMIYTIFQAWGQMCGSYMIATEATRGYAVLSVIGQIVSVICVFLFQVPNFLFEKSLGSAGIGLTYVCANYISVIVMMIYILRNSKGSQWRVHAMYLIAILSCGGASYLIRFLFGPIFFDKGFAMGLLGIVLSGLLYSLVIGAELYSFPTLVGVKRDTINRLMGKVTAKWKKR